MYITLKIENVQQSRITAKSDYHKVELQVNPVETGKAVLVKSPATMVFPSHALQLNAIMYTVYIIWKTLQVLCVVGNEDSSADRFDG